MSESIISDYGSEDVAQTLAILTQLKAENNELKRNFDNLKALHLQLNEGHKTLQARYTALYEERNNVEKQYQSLCESWRVELEEKQRLLEACKAQILGPRDMDVLRVKLLEELEAPYKAKCENLAKEAESSHQHYTKLRREYEELQNTYRSLEVRTVGEQEAHRLEKSAMSREVREKTTQLTTAQGKVAAAETTVRALQRDLEAARYSGTQIKQELDEVRRAKERANVDREAAAVQADKKVKEAQEETAQLMAFVESVTRKNRHLVQELAESQRAAEDLFAANVRLQNAQSQLQAQMESANRMAAGEKTTLAADHEEAIRRLEDKLAAALSESGRRDSALSELRVAQQEEVAKLTATWETRLSEEKRAASERVRELLDERANLHERLGAQQRAAEERKREDDAALRQAQAEADGAQREAQVEEARANGLAKQLVEATAAADSFRVELGDLKGELLKAQVALQQALEKRNDLERQMRAAEEAMVQVRSTRDALAAELEATRRQADQDSAAAARAADASRAAWALEKAAIAKRYQAAIKELTARHEGELHKVKRKARGAHAAVAQLTDEVADLKFKAVEANHTHHMSEVMYLSGRSSSPYREATPYTAGGTPAGGGYYGPPAAYGYGRPTTAPSQYGSPTPNVVIVTGNGTAGGGIAAAAAAGAAAGAAAQHQQQHPGSADGLGSAGAQDGAARGAGGAMVDSALLSSIAALRHRQQQYMDAARFGVQS